MSNKSNSVLYTGVTSDFRKRTYQHKEKLVPGFTNQYKVNRLAYYEVFDDIAAAISREKQIKSGSRLKKMELIDGMSLQWRDLGPEL
jgi:putative endonuclease